MLVLGSDDFVQDGDIPLICTRRGRNRSPSLSWSGAPEGTASFALTCDDPDNPEGDWSHWVVYNIPPLMTGLVAGIRGQERLADGTTQGMNDFGEFGYTGPERTPQKPHRYIFTLYALGREINAAPGLSKYDLLREIEGHVLDEARLIGVYY